MFVVDGMSDDGTRAVVENVALRHPYVRLLDNPKKITPAALNVGITAAKGDVVMRIDAHYEYPTDYISRLVHWLQQSGADNVGGIVVMEPGQRHGDRPGHRRGRVPSLRRSATPTTASASPQPRWVDTVPFGCYRKEVFDRIGLFDEELVRNQDIEFNLRLVGRAARFSWFPTLFCTAMPATRCGKMATMYYQYGYFNPLVIRKSGGRIHVRQVVTPLFAATLLSLIVLAFCSPWMRLALAALLLPIRSRAGELHPGRLETGPWRCGLALCVVFPVLHISHGLGFLSGRIDLVVLRRDDRTTSRRANVD